MTADLDYGHQLVYHALLQVQGEKPGRVFNAVQIGRRAPELSDREIRRSLFWLERHNYVRRHRVPGRYKGTLSKTLYWSAD